MRLRSPAACIRPISQSLLAVALMPSGAVAQTARVAPAAQAAPGLPRPEATPLRIDPDRDPVLALGRSTGSVEDFRRLVTAAVDRHPVRDEAEASIAEGRAARREAISNMLPSGDATLTSYQVLSRRFGSGGLQNIVERTRPDSQTDALYSLNQLAFDGGATFRRISAANARIRAAVASVDDAGARVALNTIGAWYDVFTFRTLIALTKEYRQDQVQRRLDLMARVMQGVQAEGDVARVDSALAQTDTRLANYGRQLASAEARFQELTGAPAPASIYRSPGLGQEPRSVQEARIASLDVPSVKVAAEQAAAARYDARAANADILPVIGLSLDSGRYGVFETDRDYDVRARVTLRARLGGQGPARRDAARARATGAEARAATAREEASRDAAIAYSDIGALDQQLVALRAAYLASRQSRDVIVERFRVTRGTLSDLLDVNETYFSAATSYVNTLADRDAAHYVLLARTGRLLNALGISPAATTARIK